MEKRKQDKIYVTCDENVRKIASDERSREEYAARTINAWAAAGLSRPAGMLRRINVIDVRQKEK
jgi:hypothetical protein